MKRILYVCIQSSPHVARWIDCVADAGFDLHMFGHDQHPPNKLLRNVTLHWPVPSQELQPSGRPETVAPVHLGLSARARRFFAHARRNPADALRILGRKLAGRSLGPTLGGGPTADMRKSRVRIEAFEPALVESGRIPFWDTDADYDALNGPAVLADVIRRVKPDLIHSMEFQHCAYLVLAARDLMGTTDFPPWLATNWGSDIFLFGRDPKHASVIRRVLTSIDLYSAECHRDLRLGREFGYRGPDLPVLPNSGGMDLQRLQRLRGDLAPSRRKQIMVKGYDHFAGRAMTSLDVVERFENQLRDYEIVLYSVSARPRERALALKASGRFNIRVIDYAEHDEIMWNFGRSRVYLGISISDAISTSVLESMAMGCFPIQTNTSCCDEWFEDGVGGFTIPPDDLDVICARFERALLDDELVDNAREINAEVIRRRLDKRIVDPKVRDFYSTAFQHVGQ